MDEEAVLGGTTYLRGSCPPCSFFCGGGLSRARVNPEDRGFRLWEVHPRALDRMEREDLVVSERDGLDHGPTRRWYSITAPGESYLESWSDSLARYQEEIGLFFALYEGAARGARGGMRG